MKDIAIEYKWWFINRRLNRQIPERWEELNARQLIAVAKISLGCIADDNYLHEFGDVPLRVIKKLDTYQKYCIGKLMTFTEGFEPWYKFILKLPGLVSPRPRLEGMTFGQLIFADTFYGDWVTEPTPENLNKFVGSIYIPKGEKKFDTERLSDYSENAAQLQECERVAITLNYRLLKEWLTNLYPMVFIRPDESDDDEGKNKKLTEGTKTSGWLDIFESIVGDDIIHQEAYFDLPAHNVLRFLSKKIKDNAKG